jgi:hypothetical protein
MGAAAAVTAAVLGTSTAKPARAKDGDIFIVGNDNWAASRTVLERTNPPPTGLDVETLFVLNNAAWIPPGGSALAVRGSTSSYNGGIGVEGTADGANNVVGVRGQANPYGLPSGYAGGIGVYGHSWSQSGGTGVVGRATAGEGVFGVGGGDSNGVHGQSAGRSASGVLGESTASGYGVTGSTTSAAPQAGVLGVNAGSGYGVRGTNTNRMGEGVFGEGKTGVHGQSTDPTGVGVWGENIANGNGVVGATTGAAPQAGVWGVNNGGTGYGVHGSSDNGEGVFGEGKIGVHGQSASLDAGVLGENTAGGSGVVASSVGGTGLVARSLAPNGVAVRMEGLLRVLSNAVGTATVPPGASSVTVTNPAVTNVSIILITPQAPVPSPLFVTGGTAGTFTITTSSGAAVVGPVPIVYLVIN